MVEAERAFARTSVEEGQREAWLRWFADDGVMFAPGPVNAKQVTATRPPEAKPFPATLYWEPIYGAIARSGELGFNTGPWRIRDNKGTRPELFGYFFSVWKKQADGTWRVAIDLGARPTVTGDPFGREYAEARFGAGTSASPSDLQTLDRTTALDAALHERAWLLRDGVAPMTSAAAARAYLAGKPSATLTPLGGDVARSGDLGYTYGSYAAGEEKGHYARVWVRDDAGAWKVGIDVVNPLPRTP